MTTPRPERDSDFLRELSTSNPLFRKETVERLRSIATRLEALEAQEDHARNQEHWWCPCGYMNTGLICTKCFTPRALKHQAGEGL